MIDGIPSYAYGTPPGRGAALSTRYKPCSGYFNERRIERQFRLWFAQKIGCNIVNIADHAEVELLEDELGIVWYDEIGFFDGVHLFSVPYPHYAFPRPLPTELKGIAV